MSRLKLVASAGIVLSAGVALAGPWVKDGDKPVPDPKKLLSTYVRRFNACDEETVTNAFPNAVSEKFLAENVPLFACPDREIERTYYFRWWTYRKHLRKGKKGGWRVTE